MSLVHLFYFGTLCQTKRQMSQSSNALGLICYCLLCSCVGKLERRGYIRLLGFLVMCQKHSRRFSTRPLTENSHNGEVLIGVAVISSASLRPPWQCTTLHLLITLKPVRSKIPHGVRDNTGCARFWLHLKDPDHNFKTNSMNTWAMQEIDTALYAHFLMQAGICFWNVTHWGHTKLCATEGVSWDHWSVGKSIFGYKRIMKQKEKAEYSQCGS